ncbi:hypothetical protein [Actinokineospora sp. NBRC 105648]|uniref:hypothetical protein n=1 Tax=Actinokineospora sp. NBRC 105648 TaxID=3032206 RepID=UPI0024A1226E|nr:hypothetical protein [Actinokineospora sp. NBRC 105648]GLZ42272.1 hypothetical protein Acsp05_58960 [Actinokineospora sp. NBRC 105648]
MRDTRAPAVTRMELHDCVGDAFLVVDVGKADLLNAALRCDARPAVFAAINRLPERLFTSTDDVWACLVG